MHRLDCKRTCDCMTLRSPNRQLISHHPSEMADVIMSSLDDRSTRLYRWRERKEQEDLQTYGKHRRVSPDGSCRAKKQKMARQELSGRAQPHPSLPSSFDTSLSTLFLSHRICSILTGPLFSTLRSSTTTRNTSCRAPRPLSTSLASVPQPAPVISPTSSNGMHPIPYCALMRMCFNLVLTLTVTDALCAAIFPLPEPLPADCKPFRTFQSRQHVIDHVQFRLCRVREPPRCR